MHKHLTRLERAWVETPIYFVTTCTEKRRKILARDIVAEILVDEWRAAHERHGWLIGRYVVMPDHVHFFCAPERDAKPLSDFIGAWKRWTSRRINKLLGPGTASPATTGRASPATRGTAGTAGAASPATTARRGSLRLWQPEFFDHLIRSDESYDQKWDYVRNNPVRAGLAGQAEDWRFAGELTTFRR